MPFFVCRLNPPRPSFATDMSAEEAQAMADHVAYWQGHAERGAAVLFGPVLDPDGVWGLAVVEAERLEAVEALTAADPAIRTGIGCRYDILPMLTATVRPGNAAGGELRRPG
jgi:uncharacterized protein YciI